MANVFDIAEGRQSVFDIAEQGNIPAAVVAQPDLARDIEPLPETDVTTFGPRAAGALLGSALAFVPSGWAGYAKLLTSGPEEAVKTIEEIQSFFPSKLLPEPHQQEAFEKTPPLWALGKIQEYKERIGDATMKATGSPFAGATAATIFEAGVFLGLPWLLKRVNTAIKTKKANNIFLLEKDAKVKQALADYEASKVGQPLLEPDVTPIKSARVPAVEERLGKRPVYEGKSDPARVIPKPPPESVFDVAETVELPEPKIVDIAERMALGLRGSRKKPSQGEMRVLRDAGFATEHLDHTFTLNEKGRALILPQKKKLGEIARKKGTTLSMLGTQGIVEGVAKDIPKLLDLSKKTVQAVQDFGAVEPRFIRHNAPETGFHAKNYFSKWAAWEERSIDKVAEVARIANFDKNLTGLDAVLTIGSKEALARAPEGVRAVGKEVLGFTENIKQEYAKRGIKLDFKGRIVANIKELIKNAEDSEVPQLEKALKAAEDMNFLHIPTALWIESELKGPTSGKVLKLLATQKRKSLNVKTLIDRGLVDPKDVNVFDIMASYGRRAGRDFALLDLKDAAKAEGLFSKEATGKNIAKIPAFESPIFADGYMHPVLADYIRGELLGKGLNLGKLGKVFAFAKLSAFINPIILPFYDTMQHGMLSLTNKWSRASLKSNLPFFHLTRGARQFIKRTPEYYEALDNGLASKPFNNPFGTYEKLIKWAQKNKQQKALSALNNVFDRRVVLNIYRASFETAWNLDQMIRMGSYDLLRKKGFSVRDSAQFAARAHSDYASVPASARRLLNAPFFTPTFKITMGKFYGTMMVDAVRFGAKLGGVLGKVDPKTKIFAGALAGTVIANLAYDQLMIQGFGMKRDEFGRRYTKEVDTDQGTKEITVTMSSPINMWQKYVFRAISSRSPEVAKPWVRFFEQNKWEIQPIFRVGYEIAVNNNGKGDKIYSEFDTTGATVIKSLRYATKSIVRLFGLIDRDPSDKEGIERFQKEYGKLTEILLRPITFTYLRSPEGKRIGFKLKAVQNRFNKQLRRGEIKPEHIQEYQRQMEKLLKQVE